jgi:hypothetical protein
MGQRLQLHSILKAITTNVYFQPPSTMAYPCIKYQLDTGRTEFADNIPYRDSKRYQVTIIDSNPDSLIPDKVKALPTCTFNRFFVADNLNHFVYTLYF